MEHGNRYLGTGTLRRRRFDNRQMAALSGSPGRNEPAALPGSARRKASADIQAPVRAERKRCRRGG